MYEGQSLIPDRGQLKERADRLIGEIYSAFKSVDRAGGVSWSECRALDDHRGPEQCREARLSDLDTDWTQLIDDSAWRPFPGVGGFAFIDAIGFRYYLAPTMIRMVRDDAEELFSSQCLNVIEQWVRPEDPEHTRLLNHDQMRCVARFIDFMADVNDAKGYLDREPEWHEALEHLDDAPEWREALVRAWHRHL